MIKTAKMDTLPRLIHEGADWAVWRYWLVASLIRIGLFSANGRWVMPERRPFPAFL